MIVVVIMIVTTFNARLLHLIVNARVKKMQLSREMTQVANPESSHIYSQLILVC